MVDTVDVTGLGMSFGSAEEGLKWRCRRLPRRSADIEVNRAMILNFCALVEDADPVYWHGDVAPWGLLMTWSMPAPWYPGRPRRPSLAALEIPLPGRHIINVATDTEFHRPLRVGDRATWDEEVIDISSPKTTRLGTGHFINTRTTYYRTADEKAAEHTNILFRYDVTERGRARAAPNARPAVETAHNLPLPPIRLDVDYRRVVHNAAATWDWFPGHHNPDYARGQGQRTIYLSTRFFHGFVDRAVREWLGPAARIGRRRIHMHRSVYAGQTATALGRAELTAAGARVSGMIASAEGPAVSFTVDTETDTRSG